MIRVVLIACGRYLPIKPNVIYIYFKNRDMEDIWRLKACKATGFLNRESIWPWVQDLLRSERRRGSSTPRWRQRLTTYKTDLLEDLRDPEYAAIYLESALEGGSSEQFLLALRDVAEARKIRSIAQASNLNRENLYKMLSVSGNPRLKSLTAILDSVGLRLSAAEALSSVPLVAPPTAESAPRIKLAPNGPRKERPLNPDATGS